MKRKSEIIPRITVIALVILAFFLAISLISDLYSGGGPNLVTVIGLLVTVIICVSFGSWLAFEGETLHQILLLVSLLLGSGLLFLLSLFFGVALAMSSPAWMEHNPSAVSNLYGTMYSLQIVTLILAVEAIVVLTKIMEARRK